MSSSQRGAETELRAAAARGDLAAMAGARAKGARDYNKAALRAAAAGHENATQALLDWGATNVDSALRRAAAGGHTALVRRLLSLDGSSTARASALAAATSRPVWDALRGPRQSLVPRWAIARAARAAAARGEAEPLRWCLAAAREWLDAAAAMAAQARDLIRQGRKRAKQARILLGLARESKTNELIEDAEELIGQARLDERQARECAEESAALARDDLATILDVAWARAACKHDSVLRELHV
ncbi:MAG: hypothetical protein WC700_04350 [Gemmatimonadaceae bacterium]|jgi:hypothetical protein